MERLGSPLRKRRSRRDWRSRRRLTGSEPLEERTVLAAGALSHVAIDPPGTLASASTFSNGSFTITNNSTAGQQITSVSIDLSTAMFPDMVFDPNGGAGDLVAKGFTVNSNPGVGLTGLRRPDQPHLAAVRPGRSALRRPAGRDHQYLHRRTQRSERLRGDGHGDDHGHP